MIPDVENTSYRFEHVQKFQRDCVLPQENTIASNKSCIVRGWVARVPISVICHDPLC